MKVLIGLGNPGREYAKTRHNVGHFVLDELRLEGDFEKIKTDCYMNVSGEFVRKIVKEKNLEYHDLMVLHDDWDFEIGDYRIQYNRGANHHKGVESIISALGTKEFWRIRIGVGPADEGLDRSEFVLSKLNSNELGILKSIVPRIESDLLQVVPAKNI